MYKHLALTLHMVTLSLLLCLQSLTRYQHPHVGFEPPRLLTMMPLIMALSQSVNGRVMDPISRLVTPLQNKTSNYTSI